MQPDCLAHGEQVRTSDYVPEGAIPEHVSEHPICNCIFHVVYNVKPSLSLRIRSSILSIPVRHIINYVPGLSSLDMNGKNYESGLNDHEAEKPDKANFPVYKETGWNVVFVVYESSC